MVRTRSLTRKREREREVAEEYDNQRPPQRRKIEDPAEGVQDHHQQLQNSTEKRHQQLEAALVSAKALQKIMQEESEAAKAINANMNLNLCIGCTINICGMTSHSKALKEKLDAHIKLLEEILRSSRLDVQESSNEI